MFDSSMLSLCSFFWFLVYLEEVIMNSLLIIPVKFKRYDLDKIKKSNPRSLYTRRFVPQKRRSHRSMIFEAKEEIKYVKVSTIKVVKSAHKPKSRAVIRPVHINDIQFADDYSYVLHYCKWCDFGIEVEPVSLKFARYEEAYQAFKEALMIQRKQGII